MKTLITHLICLASLFASAQPAESQPVQAAQSSQPIRPSTHDFIMDCMKSVGEIPHKEMVLWIPARFWEIVGSQMNIPPESISTIVKEMSPYMMFCVVDYSIQGQQIMFRSAEDIRPTLKMVDSAKRVYLPLAEKDISPIATRMVNQFQPLMAKLLGQFGDGMHIFMFDAMGADGKPGFDVAQSNRFLLTWDAATAKWSLPFVSMLPPKYCPVDKEVMQGDWIFCPFHGVRLLAQ